jgi:glycosyltransferase involved in cell wall biosynthesis
MKFSIVIPAHNEESTISACFDSIERAAKHHPSEVETIVVLNRCTDATEEIATSRGAIITRDDRRNLAMIRNTGARQATGEALVTIDADSRMSENTLEEIEKALASGIYIGGGVPIMTERRSLGIMMTGLLLMVCIAPMRISAGLFWCYNLHFQAIGGFNESLMAAEDIDFALRLKKYGKQHNKRYGTLRKARLVTSCRKFDKFGDWFVFLLLLKNPSLLWRGPQKIPQAFSDRYFYDFEH